VSRRPITIGREVPRNPVSVFEGWSCGGRTRTDDLWVMSSALTVPDHPFPSPIVPGRTPRRPGSSLLVPSGPFLSPGVCEHSREHSSRNPEGADQAKLGVQVDEPRIIGWRRPATLEEALQAAAKAIAFALDVSVAPESHDQVEYLNVAVGCEAPRRWEDAAVRIACMIDGL
jgi:hypothetical protein